MVPAWVGPVASAAFGMFGAERANRINQAEAEKNRRFQSGEAATNRLFQERMRNTEWQAAVEDMRQAGINPALAYARGGASSPSGSMAGGAVAAPAHDSVSSAAQALRMRKEIELMTQSIRKTEAEADVSSEVALREKARNAAYGIEMGPDGRPLLDVSMPGLYREVRAGVDRAVAEAARAGSMADISGLGSQVAGAVGDFMPALSRITGVAGQGAEQLAGVVEWLERAARMRDDTLQRMFGLSRQAAIDLQKALNRALTRRQN